jgi:hypothetical protein
MLRNTNAQSPTLYALKKYVTRKHQKVCKLVKISCTPNNLAIIIHVKKRNYSIKTGMQTFDSIYEFNGVQ